MNASSARLTRNLLGALAVISIAEAFWGLLPYTALDLTLSLVLLLFATRTANALCALYTKATPTPDSSYITALILYFVLTPIASAHDAFVFIVIGALSMFSKYVLAWRKVHIFNPAALTILVVGIFFSSYISWWVATLALFPLVLIFGFMVARSAKLQKLYFGFLVTTLFFFGIRTYMGGMTSLLDLIPTFIQFVTLTPLFFFAAFILMDPQTIPFTSTGRRAYTFLASLVYALSYPVAVVISSISASPALGVVLGNAITFVTGRCKQRRHLLRFHGVEQLSKRAYEFSFVPDKPIQFAAGQHMEFTILHKSPDNRGIRRYFTMTSAPNDPLLRFSTRIPVESSTFKDALRDMKKDAVISATNVRGSFTLSRNPAEKIFAIAGGSGIAPFMSMFRQVAMLGERRDIVLIYSAITPLEFIFQEEIDFFKDTIGLRVIYLPIDFPELSDWTGPSGHITPEFVKKEVRDFRKRTWYLSGSELQLQEYQWLAKMLLIAETNLRINQHTV
jgi:ferredoxin-NADP reductase